MSVQGKNAIVTGSTSGIGLAIAKALSAAGANVAINGFGDKAAIDAEVAGLQKNGGKCLYHGADMTKPEEIADLIAQTEKTFGSVDILVNNAGIQHTAATEDFPLEKWNAIIAINLSAVFHGIHAALPGMKKQNYGRIINIASVHGLVASKNKAAYVAAKHGVVGLTKVVGLECAEQNITCNAICPAWVHTPLVQKQIEDKAKQEGISVEKATENLVGEKQPNKRFVKPEQLGELVLFLCSDAASSFTGASLPIDGGWTAQ